jgi:hypothetical protein
MAGITRETVTTSLDKRTIEMITRLSNITRINKSKLYDEAILDLYRKYETRYPELKTEP